jgi:hypothetical protein
MKCFYLSSLFLVVLFVVYVFGFVLTNFIRVSELISIDVYTKLNNTLNIGTFEYSYMNENNNCLVILDNKRYFVGETYNIFIDGYSTKNCHLADSVSYVLYILGLASFGSVLLIISIYYLKAVCCSSDDEIDELEEILIQQNERRKKPTRLRSSSTGYHSQN